MKRLYKAVKVFVVATFASMLVTGASVYYAVPEIMNQIDAAERTATAQYSVVTTRYEAADEQLSDNIDKNVNNIGSVGQALINLRDEVSTNNSEISLQLKEADARTSTAVEELSQSYRQVNTYSTVLRSEIEDMLNVIIELNKEVDNLIMRQDELTLVQAGVISANIETIHSARDNFESNGACPTTIINREDHLPQLRRAVRNTSSQYRGTHNVLVKYNITEDGSTEFKEVESGTASDDLLQAVQQYVGALVFEKPNNSFANCEMIVKLEIS